MSLLDQTVTLHLRGEEIGRDPFNVPIYGPPLDAEVPAWWEPSGSEEDLASAEQTSESYWVYTEDIRARAADAITLQLATGPLRCELAPPQTYPPGTELGSYSRILVTAVSG